MIKTYAYALGDVVWTLQDETNIVEAWTVKQVTISVVSVEDDGTIIKYVLAGKRGSLIFLEENIYETLADALSAIP